MRVVCHFSCGATSAVATKLAITGRPDDEVQVIYCDTRSEHPDNARFLKECERWFGRNVTILSNPRYENVDDVIETERFINGPKGAKCTQKLKVEVRKKFQRPDDLHVYGFHAGEVDRAVEFRHRNPEMDLWFPLIDRNLFHADCLALLQERGIELPMMYRMGYRNNNCPGCVKGGMGYWNKIRTDFPEVFERRAKQERMLGRSCIKGVFLDELEPGRGRYSAEPDIKCGAECEGAIENMENCESGKDES